MRKIKKSDEFINENNENLIPIMTKEESVYYVDESDFIKFIEKNSDYEWNYLCDKCRSSGLFNEDGKTYYTGKVVKSGYNTEFATEWVNKFYDAHPWIKQMMIVFDD